ncbi:MAG: response regulator transcription factor [Angelakisella sp.]|jgi:DNA-binding response OmpR family regulator|nr:response regulator transcription factor [Angelakisella sp.]
MAEECVLIVDDDPSVRKVLEKVITMGGLEAVTAASGEKALELLGQRRVDLIILDVMMGEMDGFEVVQELRRQKNDTPIMILSARNEDYDTLYGLDIGADDYITKPFNPVLLGAKVKALLRRSKTSQGGGQPVQAGPFVYHSDTMRLEKNGREVALSAKESVMIKLFLDHVGQVFTKEQLYQHVWGEVLVDPNAVMVYISHLRNKLEEDPKNPRYLRTVWGMGYKFVVEEA